MATKEKPMLNLAGDRQAETIQECFRLKEESTTLVKEYKEAKEKALPIIFKKIINHWKKTGTVAFGGYILKLTDGSEREIAVQNTSSKKKFSPAEVKTICETIGCKGGDTFDIKHTTEINPKILERPKIKNKVLETLKKLEKELKENGDLQPEETLVEETRELYIAEHAISRLIAKETEIKITVEEALQQLKDPITCLIKE